MAMDDHRRKSNPELSASKGDPLEFKASPSARARLSLKTLPLSDEDSNTLEACRLRYGPRESLRLLKNLFVIGLAFVMLFSAYLATVNLQSSINQEDGVGTLALGTRYTAYIAASLFLPPLVIYKLRAKSTLIVAVAGYVLYVAAQFHPTALTLMTTGAFSGVCGSLLWTASSAYVARIAQEYAYLKKLPFATVYQQFFGIFFVFYHSAQVWGNLISAAVLSTGEPAPAVERNFTFEAGIDIDPKLTMAKCGAQFCTLGSESEIFDDGHEPTIFAHPEMSKIYLLFGIYAGFCAAAAVITFFFLDSTTRYGECDLDGKAEPKSLELLIAAIKHHRKPAQILIIPISIWTGMQEAFISVEFTMAFIACAWGIDKIGLVMLSFGVFAALFSVLWGRFTEFLGRPAVFCLGGVMNLGCLVTMLIWDPSSSQNPTTSQAFVYFAVTGIWGVAAGAWEAQIKALYADVFPHTAEPAFTNAGFWISMGYVITFMVAGRICMGAKIWMCIGFVGLAIGCYLCIEVLEKRKKKQKQKQQGKRQSMVEAGETNTNTDPAAAAAVGSGSGFDTMSDPIRRKSESGLVFTLTSAAAAHEATKL